MIVKEPNVIKDNAIPDDALEVLAQCLYPMMVRMGFFHMFRRIGNIHYCYLYFLRARRKEQEQTSLPPFHKPCLSVCWIPLSEY